MNAKLEDRVSLLNDKLRSLRDQEEIEDQIDDFVRYVYDNFPEERDNVYQLLDKKYRSYFDDAYSKKEKDKQTEKKERPFMIVGIVISLIANIFLWYGVYVWLFAPSEEELAAEEAAAKIAEAREELVSSGVKKPVLMVIPSDKWCIDHGFTKEFVAMDGEKIKVPDYEAAFIGSDDLPGVISNVGQRMTSLNYSLKDCQHELSGIKTKGAEDKVTKSTKSGAELKETPLDMLKRVSKADIIIQIGWIERNENSLLSSKKSVEFTIEAFDSYTNKRIATSHAISDAVDEIVPRIIATEMEKHIDAFDSQMIKWFIDTKNVGREISLRVKVWDNSPINLETETESGEEFIDVIQNWMKKNTVNGAFNLSDNTETTAQFEQIRVPLVDDQGNAVDARAFATMLRKYLSSNYGVTSKVMVRGLSEANIVIGEK